MVLLVIAVLFCLLLNPSSARSPSIALSDFQEYLSAGKVRTVEIGTDRLNGTFVSSQGIGGVSTTRFRVQLPRGISGSWAFSEWVLANRHGAQVYGVDDENLLLTIIVSLIPWALIFGFILVLRVPQVPAAEGGRANACGRRRSARRGGKLRNRAEGMSVNRHNLARQPFTSLPSPSQCSRAT